MAICDALAMAICDARVYIPLTHLLKRFEERGKPHGAEAVGAGRGAARGPDVGQEAEEQMRVAPLRPKKEEDKG